VSKAMENLSLPMSTPTEMPASLKRDITWKDAFWVASGVPALVLFSIGAIAAGTGNPSWVIWAASILMGFAQSFTYAEIAGLFPHKSGGASVYGAIAWVRYSKFIAPLSVWCNWVAWSPVLALGTQLAAGFVLTSVLPSDSAINTWQLTLVDLGWFREGLTLRLNSTFFFSALLLLCIFAVQHRGILQSARLQKILGIAALTPLILVAIVPFITKGISVDNLFPLQPIAHDANGGVINGSWNMAGWTIVIGGMFLAAWSTYGFETAVCYTKEFKDPRKDTFKAILYSGFLAMFVFIFVPLAFQNFLGLKGLLDPGVASGSTVGKVMADMIGAGVFLEKIMILLLIIALVLAIMTAMAGSSRTLYQASTDGWLPKYLSHVNHNGAPTRAMWTDLGFNLILLLMSDYAFLLAVSNVNYIIFNFLNLNAGWIHRLDRPKWSRPFRVPNWLLILNVVFAFANIFFLGMGADIYGIGTMWSGLFAAALIIPVFLYRHYITDKGKFPPHMLEDMELKDSNFVKRAGVWPFVTLGGGLILMLVAHYIAVY
jgi:amino acid transporter